MTWLSIGTPPYQIAPHVSQRGGSARLADMGCVPASLANGLNTVTGRRLDGDDVLARIQPWEESNPQTKGWSLLDADSAMAELGVGFENRSGHGRAGMRSDWAAGLTLTVQGISAYFANTTCSGIFNDAHCIQAHPSRRYYLGAYWRWIDDPVCGTGRWERETEIFQFAEGLASNIWYGRFTKPVTRTPAPVPPDTTDPTHRAYFARNAKVKIYKLDANGRIVKQPNGLYYRVEVWDNPASSAPCTAPVRRRTADGNSAAVTVTITKGHFYRDTIAVNSDGVDVKEV